MMQDSKQKSILLVEDEPFIIDALSYLLMREGFEIFSFTEGLGCFDYIKKTRPDLIILDMMLPHINGMEILTQLRGDAELHQTPVLVLTAKGQAKDRQAAEGAGANLFMTKPFSNHELIQAVKRLLGN